MQVTSNLVQIISLFFDFLTEETTWNKCFLVTKMRVQLTNTTLTENGAT